MKNMKIADCYKVLDIKIDNYKGVQTSKSNDGKMRVVIKEFRLNDMVHRTLGYEEEDYLF